MIFTLNLTSCSFTNKETELKQDTICKETTNQEIDKEIPDTNEIVDTLCSDDFSGRLVGSTGNEKTANYVSEIFNNINLKPLFGESYFKSYIQEVYKKYGLIDDDDNGEKKEINNVIGVIKGNDSKKAVVISAHFDHIGYQDGQIIRGALDNSSGFATLIKIANILNNESKNNAFSRDIIIASFNGEETGQEGSRAFVKDIKDKYLNLYNINIDCVGGKEAGNISLNNKSKISNKLTEAMKKTFINNKMDFSDVILKGATSDHKSFEECGLSNIYIGQDNLKLYTHNANDNPDTLNYDEINRVAEIICDFIRTNDTNDF